MGKYVLPYTSQKINEYLGKAGHLTFPIPIEDGGTNATNAAQARTNLGVAAVSHTHNTSDITSGTLPLTRGGTGASTAAEAITKLGITATATELNYCDGVTSNIQTQLNGKAASSHNHAASQITSGSLPLARGGTGATGSTIAELQASARTNIGAAAASHNHAASQITSGTLPIARGGTGATSYDDALWNLRGAKLWLAWYNSSASSSFLGGQKIPLSLGERGSNLVIVSFYNSIDLDWCFFAIAEGSSKPTNATASGSSYCVHRDFKYDSSGVTFGVGQWAPHGSSVWTDDNTRAIPSFIWVLRGVATP